MRSVLTLVINELEIVIMTGKQVIVDFSIQIAKLFGTFLLALQRECIVI